MKTAEFIKIMKSHGYTVTRIFESIFIKKNYSTILEISEYKFGHLDTRWGGFDELTQSEQELVLGTAFKYIMTPIEEREEPKKYYLRIPNYWVFSRNYLNYHTVDKSYWFGTTDEGPDWKTQFTQEEIENLPNQEFVKSLIKEEVK